jgi:hypothetical protein
MSLVTDHQPERVREGGFRRTLAHGVHVRDVLAIGLVPLVLAAVSALPRETLEGLTFDVTEPSVLTAYASHFVHLDAVHLLGNLSVYLPAVLVAYLLCVMSGRRRLFLITFVTLLVAFPFALSAMQLVFPRERFVFGFSGINAGFVGLACFALPGYLGATVSARVDERYAPVFLFVVVGLAAVLALPERGFRTEVAAAALGFALVYLAIGFRRQGVPTLSDLKTAVNSPGYFELAGAGFGLLVGYPFVAFQDAVVPQGGVVDVYVHVLGFSLAFIVVFVFVFVSEWIEQ